MDSEIPAGVRLTFSQHVCVPKRKVWRSIPSSISTASLLKLLRKKQCWKAF